MSRGSAFARVLGMTKSLSPLSFDRNRSGGDAPEADAEARAAAEGESENGAATIARSAETVVELDARDDVFSGVEMHIDETADFAAEGTRRGTPNPVSGVVMQFPGLAHASSAIGSEGDAYADREGPPAELANDMIEAIETDIASLLASMEEMSDLIPPQADAADDEAVAEGEDDGESEDATLALLSELNRMWATDPAVGVRA